MVLFDWMVPVLLIWLMLLCVRYTMDPITMLLKRIVNLYKYIMHYVSIVQYYPSWCFFLFSLFFYSTVNFFVLLVTASSSLKNKFLALLSFFCLCFFLFWLLLLFVVDKSDMILVPIVLAVSLEKDFTVLVLVQRAREWDVPRTEDRR